MKVKKNLLAFAAAAGLFCGPAWSLDLSQAYGEALEQDSTIRAVRAATDARRERLPQARAQLLPNLSASVSRYRNWLERTSPDASGQLVTADLRYTSRSEALTLRQPIFRMYQMADYRQAQAQVDDAEATLERETQNVGVRVSGAYFEALLAEEHLALVLAQKTAYTTQFDAAQKRLGAGFGTRTDIDEARAALDLNLAQELEARQNLDFTRRQIQSLVNRPIDRLAPLDSSRMRLVRPSPDRLEDWVERAEINSPELQSLVAQVEAAKYELEKAQAGHYPTLDAIVQWSRNDSDTINNIKTRYSNKSIGLQLSIPLYSGGHVSSAVRQAIAGQLRAEEALEALRRDLAVRLHREFRGVTEGVLRVRALEQAVRSSEQVVISNRRSFEAGSRTLPDVLTAEQQKVSAQRDLAQARFVYLMSRIRLQALAGGPKTEVIDEINGWLVR
ncbi:TolC family outer membrane protein [Variovorax beijingensis]|uniref:TolC family outer membrane protein n=1 Tax=Variovorax beijingensis TaxID=2496117 RepID=UPI003F69CA98